MLVKIFAVAICVVSFGCQAIMADNPYRLVNKVANKTIERMAHQNGQGNIGAAYYRQLISEELMPFIDHRFAGRVVLDKVKPDEALREIFYDAFQRYLVVTYAAVFSKYEGQKLQFEAEQNTTGKRFVSVKAKMTSLDDPDINIEFKLKFDKQSESWALYDMVVEGVSMLNSKKAELRPVLRQPEGVQTAINILNKKSGELQPN